MIHYSCPRCSAILQAADQEAGSKVACPHCGQRLQLPLPPVNKTVLAPAVDAAGAKYPLAIPLGPPGGRLEPHRGIVVFVLGIASFFTIPIILGPIAWFMAAEDLKKMRRGTMDREGEGYTNAGLICGMISTIISVGSLVAVLLLFCCIRVLRRW
jgi:DNA-directed RNA polymerase subunit RPC12/RpoP